MALGLWRFTDREGDGRSGPRLDTAEDEELMHSQPGVSIALGNLPPEAPGTLYITSKKVVWLSNTDDSKGYAVDFLSVSLHAVSRDPDAYPLPCIYTQIDIGSDEDDSDSSDAEGEGDDDMQLEKITEMRLIPSDPSHLDTLFDIFSECAELNPDPRQEQDEENEWVCGEEEMNVDVGAEPQWIFSEDFANPIGCTNGDHDLANAVLELQVSDDRRFEDADESDKVVGGHK